MRQAQRILIIAIAVAALFAAGLTLQPGQAQTPTPESAANEGLRVISVSGMGQVSAQPDTAIIVVGVQTEAEEASAALSQNNEKMEALLNALQQAGIASQDIQTQSINLSPRYEEPSGSGGQAEVTGYIASNTVEVRVGNLDQLGELLDSIVQAGGNVIQNIRFEVSEPDELLSQARQEAMDEARQKAEQLAELAGVQLGEVQSISEGTGQPPVPFGVGGAAGLEQAVPIQPGTQDLTVVIQVSWGLENQE